MITKFITTEKNIKIAYQQQGSGSPIILIHGLRASKENMLPLVKLLSQYYTVYYYDVRGHGESTHPDTLTWQNHLDDLHHFMQILNIHHATIIGHSMGSYIALSFALQYPELVSKLILIASKLEGKQSSTSRILEQLNLDINQLSSQQLIEIIDQYMYFIPMISQTKQLARQLKSPIKLSSLDIQLANEAMKQYDVVNIINTLVVPTLIIVGKMDGINDIETNKNLASHIKNSRLVIIEEASHMIQLEQPMKVVEEIHTFILEDN